MNVTPALSNLLFIFRNLLLFLTPTQFSLYLTENPHLIAPSADFPTQNCPSTPANSISSIEFDIRHGNNDGIEKQSARFFSNSKPDSMDNPFTS